MAAGQAQKVYTEDPARGPVVICSKEGKPRWHPLWQGNPAIYCPAISPPPDMRRIFFGSGCLPYYKPSYTDGKVAPREPWRARDHRATVYLTPEERALGEAVKRHHGPFLLVEPTGLDRKNKNRCWPKASWHLLTDLLAMLPFAVVQLTREHADRIPTIDGIPHQSFREALGVMSASALAILPEGGLAMGAAAIIHPAIVLWGGCSDVEIGGYPEHVNLVDDDPQTPCGSLFPCDHCHRAWGKLTPETVFAVVQQQLDRQRDLMQEVAHGLP